ncbi:hypothetical protein [Saccharopolyspora sp. NPDC002376]
MDDEKHPDPGGKPSLSWALAGIAFACLGGYLLFLGLGVGMAMPDGSFGVQLIGFGFALVLVVIFFLREWYWHNRRSDQPSSTAESPGVSRMSPALSIPLLVGCGLGVFFLFLGKDMGQRFPDVLVGPAFTWIGWGVLVPAVLVQLGWHWRRRRTK